MDAKGPGAVWRVGRCGCRCGNAFDTAFPRPAISLATFPFTALLTRPVMHPSVCTCVHLHTDVAHVFISSLTFRTRFSCWPVAVTFYCDWFERSLRKSFFCRWFEWMCRKVFLSLVRLNFDEGFLSLFRVNFEEGFLSLVRVNFEKEVLC